MLIKIYRSKKYGFPLLSSVFLLTCSIVTIPTYFQNELYYVFALQSKPFYFWQLFSGVFEHSIFPGWFLWAHYLGNMSILIIFGVFIERLLGSWKLLIISITAGIIYVAFFHIRFSGQVISGSGASGIVYAYAPIVFYILYVLGIKKKFNLIQDKIFWIMVMEFVFIWGFITSIQSWDGTNIYHFLATLVGTVFVYIYRNSVKNEIKYIMNNPNQTVSLKKAKGLLYSTIGLPLFVSIILALYFCGILNGLFVKPNYISEHDTVNSVMNNNNIVEIQYDDPITKFNSVYTSGFDTAIITYSEDRKKVYCEFPNGIKYACKIILKSSFTNNGQVVRDVVIDINE